MKLTKSTIVLSTTWRKSRDIREAVVSKKRSILLSLSLNDKNLDNKDKTEIKNYFLSQEQLNLTTEYQKRSNNSLIAKKSKLILTREL